MLEMRSPSSRTSKAASVLFEGSRTRPFLIRSIRLSLCRVRCARRGTADEMVKQGHAHGEAVGHLFENGGLRTIGHGRFDFQAANDWARVHHKRIRTSTLKPRYGELKIAN